MAQVVEDYVSFETAKLLKEKRFDIYCSTAYFNGGLVDYTMFGFCDGELLPAPSLSLACKWLRVRHNLNVEVYRTACGYIGCIVAIPNGTDIKFLEDNGDDKASGTYTKSEFATEATIKYCLENLI